MSDTPPDPVAIIAADLAALTARVSDETLERLQAKLGAWHPDAPQMRRRVSIPLTILKREEPPDEEAEQCYFCNIKKDVRMTLKSSASMYLGLTGQSLIAADLAALTARVSDAETTASPTAAAALSEARRHLLRAAVAVELAQEAQAWKDVADDLIMNRDETLERLQAKLGAWRPDAPQMRRRVSIPLTILKREEPPDEEAEQGAGE